MKRIHLLLLSLLSALLLSIPFFRWGTGLLLLVAFVPLLLVEDAVASSKSLKSKVKSRKSKKGSKAEAKGGSRADSKNGRSRSMLGYAFLTFGLFVLLTTWWVYWATWTGTVATLIVNGGYMTLTFLVFHRVRKRLGDRLGYAAFVVFWLAFEFLYIRAQINFPWLVLGYGFANDIILIQWYEWTGALGGSLWILVMNLVVFKLVKGWLKEPSFAANRKQLSWVVAVLVVPILFSVIRFLTYEEKEDPYEMVVLQPNIDPFEKFGAIPQDVQTRYLLRLADSLATPETDYIIAPETFINAGVWVSRIDEHPEVVKLKHFMENYPNAKLVIGSSTYQLYKDPSQFTASSRLYSEGPYRYDYFNSAIQIDASDEIPIYHKSMLVTGVEKMPHKEILGFLENLVVELGGAMRSNGTQEFREAFESPQDGTRVGPVICWESIFGEYVTDYVGEAGANFLFIVTNDGWWRKTPGHRQHNAYARLRAIETRRSVARSANTGISSLINQRGEELARIAWWERSGLRGTLNSNDHITFYVKHGDFLGRIAVLLTVILLLYTIAVRYIRK